MLSLWGYYRLASLSGLRRWHCQKLWHGWKLWHRSQMWLGSGVAVVVLQASAPALIWSLAWKLPYAARAVVEKKKKREREKEWKKGRQTISIAINLLKECWTNVQSTLIWRGTKLLVLLSSDSGSQVLANSYFMDWGVSNVWRDSSVLWLDVMWSSGCWCFSAAD